MPADAQCYSIDTSSLMHAWQRAYPPRPFPALWKKIDELIESERLLATIEVYYELQRLDDDIAAWAKARKEQLFREIDDSVQRELASLMRKYPRLVDTKTGKSGADPLVIAQAKCSPSCIVVTDEKGGSLKSPKIPSVCAAEGIDCISILTLIEREGWAFG